MGGGNGWEQKVTLQGQRALAAVSSGVERRKTGSLEREVSLGFEALVVLPAVKKPATTQLLLEVCYRLNRWSYRTNYNAQREEPGTSQWQIAGLGQPENESLTVCVWSCLIETREPLLDCFGKTYMNTRISGWLLGDIFK